jgi:phage gp29-like protein
MALIDRIADIVSGSGRTLSRMADALRAPRVVQSGNPSMVAPSVDGLPGVSPGFGRRAPNNEELTKALSLVDSYFGRISYDAGPGPARFSSYPATDLTPEKIAGAQQEATSGWPLRWAEMLEQVISRDSHFAGVAGQRVEDVVKGSWNLVAERNDPIAHALVSFCEQAIKSISGFSDGLGWLLWANTYGYNAVEITWKRESVDFEGPDGRTIGPIEVIVPARLDAVHPKHFRFDLRTDEPLLWLGSDGIPLPYGKFVFYKGEGQHPITARRGFGWQCVWLSMFRSIGWAGWVTFVNRFGMPIPIIEYDATIAQYDEYKTAYREILQNLGSGDGAMMPRKGANLRIEQPPAGGRSNDPHSALSDACDAAQSVRVLGATLTAKIGNVGSFAATSGHLQVKYSKEESDAHRAWEELRAQMITPIVRMNLWRLFEAFNAAGLRVTPEGLLRRIPLGQHVVPRDLGPVERMGIISSAVDMGMKVDARKVAYQMEIPLAASDNAAIPGRPQQVTGGGKVVGSVNASQGVEAPKDELGSVADQGEAPPAPPKSAAPPRP